MAKNILVLFETKEGHTKTVAQRLVEELNALGHQAQVLRSREATSDQLQAADGVMLGTSIHMGKPHTKSVRFVSEHLEQFKNKPSAFFLVCLTAKSKKPDKVEEVQGYLSKFFEQTGWQPKLFQAFAGALLYTKYNFVTRKVLKGISKKDGGDTDTSRDFIYTDWEQVREFSAVFSALLK